MHRKSDQHTLCRLIHNTRSFIIIALNYVRAAYVASGRPHIIHTHVRRTRKYSWHVHEHRIPTRLIASKSNVFCSERTSICSHAFGQFAWILLLNDGKRKFSTDLLLFRCDDVDAVSTMRLRYEHHQGNMLLLLWRCEKKWRSSSCKSI